jgi:ABC-type nitrate/sulfonate/bicarbonate transport system substrate-binding protein
MTFAIAGLFGPLATAQGHLTRIDAGYVPAAQWLPALVALEKGFFKKKALYVTITPIKLPYNVSLNQPDFDFYARMGREV